ncbi:sporulation protein YqfD [Tissierella sp. Yu-01]|uniref:sporulation protein YqfD n=1 Tax=Tissierella sp. Yu-01 TaxID=3035694 RepID=UPI00240CEBD1|nr:sporulation protein YqfD [Tissierella sp. Yu-01]WFA09550.1 sporulation protein YqfD [Tissierella sp. Yu-01]
MLAIKIWNYLKGYVIIRIEGLSLERLLNLALTNNIYLWDVKRLNYYQVEVSVSPKGLDSLLELIRKVGCKEEILQERGLPFLLERVKRRKTFVVGFILFIVSIFLLSSFIWKIEINGLEQTPNEKIIEYLNENGISSGKPKMTISEADIELMLINKFDYFSFIEVQKKGIKLVIDIKEEPLPPEIIDRDYPTNIIAKKKGVITKVVARNGEALAKVGEIVKEGQVLISGAMLTNEQEVYLVHADGEVLARTRYEAVVTEPIVKKVEKETGKVFKQKGVKFNKRGIKFIKDIPFDNYKEYIEEDKLIDWDIIDIPVRIITYEYREIEIEEVKQDIEFLKQANQIKAIEEINGEIAEGAEIVTKDVKHSIEENSVNTTVILETIEEIGKKVIIDN